MSQYSVDAPRGLREVDGRQWFTPETGLDLTNLFTYKDRF